MEWLALAVLALLGAVVVRRGGSRGRGAADPFGADSGEVADRLARIVADAGSTQRRLLSGRLTSLRSHRVPLRAIRRSPVPKVARLLFADGTVILARSLVQGEVTRLGLMREAGSVVIADFGRHPDGIEVALRGVRGDACRVLAVGLDQSD